MRLGAKEPVVSLSAQHTPAARETKPHAPTESRFNFWKLTLRRPTSVCLANSLGPDKRPLLVPVRSDRAGGIGKLNRHGFFISGQSQSIELCSR